MVRVPGRFSRLYLCMSHPEFSQGPKNAFCGVQRGGQPLWGVAGVSPATSFLSSRRCRRRRKRRNKSCAGTPRNPGRGLCPLHPLFWELLKKFGMTHNRSARCPRKTSFSPSSSPPQAAKTTLQQPSLYISSCKTFIHFYGRIAFT